MDDATEWFTVEVLLPGEPPVLVFNVAYVSVVNDTVVSFAHTVGSGKPYTYFSIRNVVGWRWVA